MDRLDRKDDNMSKRNIGINEKLLWKVEDAMLATGLGENNIRELMNEPDANFIIMRGSRKYILREAFVQYFVKLAQAH
jgi:hypothetical protein